MSSELNRMKERAAELTREINAAQAGGSGTMSAYQELIRLQGAMESLQEIEEPAVVETPQKSSKAKRPSDYVDA